MSTAAVRPSTASEGRTLRDRELQRRLADHAAEARELLGADIAPPEPGELGVEAALAMLTAVALLATEGLRAARRRSPRTTALYELALRGAELDAALRQRDLSRRTAALAGVETSLGRMRAMTAPEDLVQAVCPELVRSCGFSRAMLSRVSGTTWHPWTAHFEHRPIRPSDEEWMVGGGISLSTMQLERELLETARPAFVVDAAADPRTSKPFVTQTGTRSYAVAPIMPTGRVIGLLHADFYPSHRVVDQVDAHILGAFADSFGRIYERSVLLERLGRERDQVRDTLKNAEMIMDNLARAEVELVRHADERSSVGTAETLALAGGSSAIDELLTAREREVMTLLVTGQTNSAIAERLVISEGTVKSHVKQILRKLGAVNRSEVIARYLGLMSQG
jgi:DNA-binding CsgD family transcriptional regulator